MGGTFTSWGALEQALQKEVADATREVIDNSMEDLHRNVDRFYGAAGGRYMRTGTLRSSPECSFMGGGAVSSGEIRLNTGYTYVPSGRDTKTIYNFPKQSLPLENHHQATPVNLNPLLHPKILNKMLIISRLNSNVLNV